MTRILSLFFALCGAIALVFAGIDAYVNRQHERWPSTTAVVKSADVETGHPFPSDGGGTTYALEAFVEPPTGHARLIRSSSARSARVMIDWINAHPQGTRVNVRLDPSDSRKAELVDPEALPIEHHPREDLILAAIGAGGALVLWWIPIPKRRAQSPDRNPPSAR